MDKLKPCPFCGGFATIAHTNDNKNKPFVICKFGCLNTPPCPASRILTWDYATEAEAIKAWNRRANECANNS